MSNKKKGSKLFQSKMPARPKPVVPIEDKSNPTLMMNLMLGALRTGDETLEATAAELLFRWGQEPLRRIAADGG